MVSGDWKHKLLLIANYQSELTPLSELYPPLLFIEMLVVNSLYRQFLQSFSRNRYSPQIFIDWLAHFFVFRHHCSQWRSVFYSSPRMRSTRGDRQISCSVHINGRGQLGGLHLQRKIEFERASVPIMPARWEVEPRTPCLRWYVPSWYQQFAPHFSRFALPNNHCRGFYVHLWLKWTTFTLLTKS